MSEPEDRDFVLPAGLPLADLRGRDLEETAYWLLHAMGAQDLEWRTGGVGGGAPDGGRDLEATFYAAAPDGEMEPQRWWIECKGRKGTVEPIEVERAVLKAQGAGSLESVAIVTNTGFSNPTRDWVKGWQAQYPRPKVRLWDHGTLERLLSQHPDVVLRLFSEALSPDGLMTVMRQQFWTRFEYSPPKVLQALWAAQDSLRIDRDARFALIANEFAHGNLIDRPWGARADPDELFRTVHYVLVNLGYLNLRVSKLGVDQDPIVAALAHLVLLLLQHLEGADVADLISGTLRTPEGQPMPDIVLDLMLQPLLDRLMGEMQDICSPDCLRISQMEPMTLVGEDHPVRTYWRQFDPDGRAPTSGPQTYVFLENTTAICKVGFEVGEALGCPLYGVKPTIHNMPEVLAFVKQTAAFRRAAAAEVIRADKARETRWAEGRDWA